jgi:hypothetical protein
MPQGEHFEDKAEVDMFFKNVTKLWEHLSVPQAELRQYLRTEKPDSSEILTFLEGEITTKKEVNDKIYFESIYVCDKCRQKFKYLGRLNSHMMQFHSEVKHIYNCTVANCKYSGPSQKLLNNHMKKQHHDKPKSGQKCEHCEKELPTIITLNLHIAANHVPTKCRVDWCQVVEMSRKQEATHYQRAHSRDQGQPRLNEKEAPPPCEICGRTYKSKSGLRKHKQRHKEGNLVPVLGAEETVDLSDNEEDQVNGHDEEKQHDETGGHYRIDDGGYHGEGNENGICQDGGYQDDGHEEGGFRDGGPKNGGSPDGGFKDGGCQDGGYYEEGRQDECCQDDGSPNRGRQDGECQDRGCQDSGHQDGGRQDKVHQDKEEGNAEYKVSYCN